ncbi:MAG: phospholipid carrier-dependent glycosyltransferase [Phycisphaerae bacterium]|nr:phospholipid carrier-dependent glycosyltransferase [Phycisphaerae bacterium]
MGNETDSSIPTPPAEPTPPTPTVEVAPQRVDVPPPPTRYDRVRIWSGLLLTVLVCGPLLVLDLDTPDLVQVSEARALVTSRETWQRQHEGEARAWALPSYQGLPQVSEPPMSTWLHMLGWIDLDANEVEERELIWRVRLGSALMGLLAVMATYWAGMSIGDVRVALLASMVLGTTLLFVREARVAGADAHLLGWVALAIASGLWAMRPLKTVNWRSRRVIGWLVSGLAMGCAILTGGPVGLVFVLPPLFAAICLTPRRRMTNSLGLSFALILGLMAATPWYLYVLGELPDEGWEKLSEHWQAPTDLLLLTWSHKRALALLSPWQIWLVGALFQPFLRADRERRRQLLIAWFWFVLVAIAFSIPAAREPRYLLPVLPAMALLVAQLWAYHIQLASERRSDPGVNLLRLPHWMVLLVASVGLPAFVLAQPWLVERLWLEQIELPGLTWPVTVAVGSALLLVAIAGTIWHFRWKPRRAIGATIVWMLLAAGTGLWAHHRSHHHVNEHLDSARAVGAAAHGARLLFLQGEEPHPAFVFHLGQRVEPVAADQLKDIINPEQPVCILVVRSADNEQLMTRHGFVAVLRDVHDGRAPRHLYCTPKREPAPGN